MEFLILVGAVLFFFTVFFLAIQQNTSDKTKERENLIAKEIALTIKNEIALATDASEGYSREFEIPKKIGARAYTVTIAEDTIQVKTLDEQIALTFPIQKIEAGAIVIGETNRIKKREDGKVYLNVPEE